MFEQQILRCIELCAKTSVTRGGSADELTDTMAVLKNQLDELLAEARRVRSGQTDVMAVPIELQAKILAQLQEPIVTLDLAGYVTGWNRGAETLFGYAKEEVVGTNILFLYADQGGDAAPLHEIFLEHGTPYFEVRKRRKSGEAFLVGMSLSLLRDAEGDPIGMAAHLSDLSGRRDADDTWRLHTQIIEDSDQGILIADAEERIVSVNAAFTRITGYCAEEAIGQTPDLLRSGVHDSNFRSLVRAALRGAGPWQGEIIGRRKNGDRFPQSVSISVVRNEDGQVSHAFSIFADISVLRAAEERMQQLVNYDVLTGLPNRTLFNKLVDHALQTARRNSDHGAILVINLNRFAAVNDTIGLEVGDELLRQVGKRFRATLRDEDVLARIGGDEFVVALTSIERREHGGIVARNLLTALEKPFDIENNRLHITASIGISVYPEDDLNTGALVRFADVALKKAKESVESGYLFYDPEMNQRAKNNLRLDSELRYGLKNNQLRLFYQPKVSLRSGKIVGAEALVRWFHPENGMVSPAKFIPVAEETGLILDIGHWVMEEACRQISEWRRSMIDVPPIAVNISARQFDADLPQRIQTILDANSLTSAQIKLEITESLLVRDAASVIPIMNQLVALGLGLSLDDFGTGYSSLSYLKKYPISTLKIDRSFVVGVPTEEHDCAIARAIVTMGQQMRQEIVAEGVETIEQMSFLRDLGCDQLQGYLFSPPVAADAFAAMLLDGRHLAL